MDRFEAALLGAREVGFTVLSISLSLVAVFIPLLFMGGQVGRLFREFAVTLSAAVMISLVISLTTTPMMCAWLLQPDGEPSEAAGPRSRAALERGFDAHARGLRDAASTGRSPARPLVMLILVAVIGAQRLPVHRRAEGLLPAAGHRPAQRRPARRPEHLVPGDAGASCASSSTSSARDPAVATVVGFTGGGRAGGGFMFVNLKPRRERKESGQAVIARLRPAARAGHRRQPVPEPGAGRAHGRPAVATPPTSTR